MVLSSARQASEALRLVEQAIARDPRYGPGARLGGSLLFRLADGRPERRSGGGPSERAPISPGEPWKWPATTRASWRMPPQRAGLFRRGHRRHDGVGRPCPGAQPELRARLAHQRRPQAMGGPARHRDRACRGCAAPQSRAPESARRFSIIGAAHFCQPALRRGGAEAALAIQDDPSLPAPISRSRRLLRPYGSARRRARNRRAAARHHPGRDPRRQLSCATPSTASCSCRACAWRRARRHEPDPPARCDPRRRCGGVFAADGADEEGTLERLKALRRELLDPKIAEHRGRIVKTTGDGLLVEFASVVDAVRCAVAVQQAMPERNAGVAADNRIELRIGINLGDVIVEGDDSLWRRRQHRRTDRSPGRCRRGVRLQHGPRSCPRPAALCL